MRFPAAFLDEIRDRLPIAEVVGSRVTWDRRKTNPSKGDFWACCPFHGEKSPSFHCENAKGRYYCFGCGASGDHFRFLVELDGLSFPEAVERLADQAGLPLPRVDPREQEREDRRGALVKTMQWAAEFYQAELQEQAGAGARAYLRDRGLKTATQVEFGIGYAPDSRNALKNHLAQKGARKEDIESCGLVVHGPDIAVSYDRFRDRIMFPIPDSRGQVIAFGGRALRADIPAKYLNSPETALFHKSAVLFNFLRARRPARETGELIVCEGYMDVIAMHQAGFAQTVAPLGTALTEQQIALLWRLAPQPILCFDGDEAGLRAAYRAAELTLTKLQTGRTVRFAVLPQGRDPDDILRDEGPGELRAILDSAQPLAEFLWGRETQSGRFDTPEKRAELEARLRKLSETIPDENLRRHYNQDFADRMASLFGAPSQAGGRARPQRGSKTTAAAPGRRVQASQSLLGSPLVRKGNRGMPMRESALLLSVIHHPGILERFFEEFAALPLSGADSNRLHSAILDIWAGQSDTGTTPETPALVRELENAGLEKILESARTQLRQNGIWQAMPDAGFEDALEGWRQAYSLQLRVHSLQAELKAAEGALAEEDSEENLERLIQIQRELWREDGIEALVEGFGISSGRPSRNF